MLRPVLLLEKIRAGGYTGARMGGKPFCCLAPAASLGFHTPAPWRQVRRRSTAMREASPANLIIQLESAVFAQRNAPLRRRLRR